MEALASNQPNVPHPGSPMLERPTPGYRHLLEDLTLSSEKRRREGVAQLLIKGAKMARRLPNRNRMWADAVNLLAEGQPWSTDHEEQVLDVAALRAQQEKASHIENPPSELQELTDEVLNKTWATFDEFWHSEAGESKGFAPDMDDRIGAFQRWFQRHLPYVMIGLPSDPAAAELELGRRIGAMLDKAFLGEDEGTDGLRAAFADEAWTYAQMRWQEAYPAPSVRDGAIGAGQTSA